MVGLQRLLTVLGTFAMEPFPGARDIPQLTKGKSNTTIKVINNMLSW